MELASTVMLRPLQAFLSGGKRFASPLSSRGRASSPKDDPKGPSFADLLNAKGRSNRSLSAKRTREKGTAIAASSSLTIGVALVDAQPAAASTADQAKALPLLRRDGEGVQPAELGSAVGSTAGDQAPPLAGSEASARLAQRTLAYEEASAQPAQV